MKFVWGEFTIEGELYHMVLFPLWGSSDIGFLPGEGLPYGIPSGGRLPYGIISGGGGGVRGG